MRCFRPAADLAVLLGLLLISGCGESAPAPVQLPKTVPVSGTVKLDGKPLAGARVSFIPTGNKTYGAEGVTNESGVYELSVTADSKPVVGAIPGSYNVRISRSLAPDGTPLDSSKPMEVPGLESLPPQYSDPNLTKLNATVAGTGGTQDFDLKSK